MSYQVLARKWRPKSFATLVGQEHVVRALTHALREGRLHHAYLFTGTRGVGKTTLARILAKALNCETGITPEPCGQCAACQEIDAGRFVDLLEVDAATNTRVDEMRQLLENAVYAPTRGRFKVYVIDEVHMLSTSAFNAMLKTLEEPPEHVKFILATTDPQKIPVTVLSRCLQFSLKQMPPAAIAGHLARILEAESVPVDEGAIRLVAHAASGSMRDALSLLDQAIAHGAGRVEEAAVRDMLGAVDRDYIFSLLDGLRANDAAAMLAVAANMNERSLSLDLALQELAGLLTRIQVAQLAPQAVDESLPERERLVALAQAFDPEFVQLAYQIAVQGRADLSMAPDDYTGFTMTLLRLAAFSPLATGAAEKKTPDSVKPRHAAGAVTPAAPSLAGPAASRPAAPVLVAPTQRREAPPVEAPPAKMAAPASAPARTGGEVPDWRGMIAAMRLGGLVRELAQHCELRALEEGVAVLALPPAHRHLLVKVTQDKLQQTLSRHLGRDVAVRIELAEAAGDTPAVQARREREAQQERAIAAIEQDGFVRELIEVFDATLIESTIKPLQEQKT